MKREYLMYKDLIECGLAEKHNNLHYRQIETPRPNRGKCIYVLCGYFPGYSKPIKKIGISNDPLSRYQTIIKDCPYPIFIDYIFRGACATLIEKDLHHKFKDKRIRNGFCKSGETEWFFGVTDEQIIEAVLHADSTLNKKIVRIGKSKHSLWQYHCKPGRGSDLYFSEKINYSELLKGIEVEQKSPTFNRLLELIENNTFYPHAKPDEEFELQYKPMEVANNVIRIYAPTRVSI
jgi:hypothetical protein